MAEVMRYQLQQESLREASDGRLRNSLQDPNAANNSKTSSQLLSLVSTNKKNFDRQTNTYFKPLKVTLKKVVVEEIISNTWADFRSQHVQISIGSWVGRTVSKFVTGSPLEWCQENIALLMSMDRLRVDDAKIEVFNENELISDTLLGSATVNLSSIIGINLNSENTFSLNLTNRQNVFVAKVEVTLEARYPEDDTSRNDSITLLQEEILLPTNGDIKTIDLKSVDDIHTYPKSAGKLAEFSSIVSDFRGDGDDLMRMLIGDITLPALLEKGHRVNFLTVKVFCLFCAFLTLI